MGPFLTSKYAYWSEGVSQCDWQYLLQMCFEKNVDIPFDPKSVGPNFVQST